MAGAKVLSHSQLTLLQSSYWRRLAVDALAKQADENFGLDLPVTVDLAPRCGVAATNFNLTVLVGPRAKPSARFGRTWQIAADLDGLWSSGVHNIVIPGEVLSP